MLRWGAPRWAMHVVAMLWLVAIAVVSHAVVVVGVGA